MIKSLLVLGGGNAGLMSALYHKKSIDNLDITLIKSDKIGTIGVGEGSTEHWRRFADAVGITMTDLARECGATIKIGIKFEDWHGDKTSYYHSLPEPYIYTDAYTGDAHTMMRLISEGVDSESLHWDLPMQGYVSPPFEDYYQFHFDSEKLNAFLEKRCVEAGINVITTEVEDVIINGHGFVESVIDVERRTHNADFFIDSSGFKRVIASKLGAKWVDWSEFLPMNSAIAFQTPRKEDIPPYTLSKALTAGWHWRSPVQERFGNGYVFSDQFISEDEATAEIQSLFSDTINIGRKINFVSGKVDKFWIKNCVSIGLSSNFVEPLEASSISATIQQSRALVAALATWQPGDEATINEYNRIFDDCLSNVLDFIQLHYFTQREDSKFWRWCKNEIKYTDFNKENLENFKKQFVNQILLPEDGSHGSFRIYDHLNWIQVMHGLRMFDIPSIQKIYNERYSKYRAEDIAQLSMLPQSPGKDWMKCREAVETLKGRTTYSL